MNTINTIFAIMIAALAVYVAILIGLYVVQVIAHWKIFTKAGDAGWKSLIPVYSGYTQYKLCWNTTMFWISFAAILTGMVMSNVENSAIAMMGTVLSLAGSVISLIGTHKLSTAFGHGIGFTIGLILLNPIFILILGFGSSEYQGPQ